MGAWDGDFYFKRPKNISRIGFLKTMIGQTAFEVHPDTDFKIIPKDMNKIQTEYSGNRFVVSSNADGCIVYIRKKT